MEVTAKHVLFTHVIITDGVKHWFEMYCKVLVTSVNIIAIRSFINMLKMNQDFFLNS